MGGEMLAQGVAQSTLQAAYGQPLDRESAYEVLNAKIADAAEQAPEPAAPAPRGRAPRAPQSAPSVLDEIARNPLVKQVARTATSQLTRTILGTLFKRR